MSNGKMKTRKSAAKRFRVSGSGKKIKYKKQGRSHILTKKSRKTKRNLRKPGVLSQSETKRAKRVLPYDF